MGGSARRKVIKPLKNKLDSLSKKSQIFVCEAKLERRQNVFKTAEGSSIIKIKDLTFNDVM